MESCSDGAQKIILKCSFALRKNPADKKLIKIINVNDFTKTARVILNLNTDRPFELLVKGHGSRFH